MPAGKRGVLGCGLSRSLAPVRFCGCAPETGINREFTGKVSHFELGRFRCCRAGPVVCKRRAPMGSVTDWLVEADLGAGGGSAETEFCLLFGPVEGDAGADEAFETELGGLGAFKNGRLYLWGQKRQRRPGIRKIMQILGECAKRAHRRVAGIGVHRSHVHGRSDSISPKASGVSDTSQVS